MFVSRIPLLLLLALPPAPLVAQPPDSARLLRDARREQAAFETVRRSSLPWTLGRGGGGTCDERVGRFCLWHDPDASPWKPKPEPSRVTERRERLLARLGSAAVLLPGDRWIAGQRVRYLAEAGRMEDAVAAARACRAEAGWCGALLGYAEHASGNFPSADSAFAAALAAMPPERRRAWTDLAPLLPPDEERAYRRLGAAERERVEARFWWLADPLWAAPGNDRRTEHFARQLLADLQDHSRSAEGIPWGDDLRELLLRYGWPVGWERASTPPFASGPAPVTSHYAPESWHFLPPLPAARDPAGLSDEQWTLDAGAPRTSYAPPYARGFGALRQQVALFRRGDSTVVVAAYELADDSLPADAALEVALVSASDERTPPTVARGAGTGRAGVIRGAAPGAPRLVSVEVVAPRERRVGRARLAVHLGAGAGVALSDVLLLRPGSELPDALPAAAERARPGLRVTSGERVGLFWEVYRALPREADVRYELALVPDRAGWLERAAARAGIGRERAEVRIGWTERLGAVGISPRALALGTEGLRPGRYTLRLTLRTPGGAASAERAVEVVR